MPIDLPEIVDAGTRDLELLVVSLVFGKVGYREWMRSLEKE
jgi:hypothetical protein